AKTRRNRPLRLPSRSSTHPCAIFVAFHVPDMSRKGADSHFRVFALRRRRRLSHQPARPIGSLTPRKLFLLAALLAIAAGTGSYLIWRGVKPAQASRSVPTAVPVSVASATRKNVPIFLTGLGTVQATYTVGIHSQVDGKLQDVFFKE